MSPIAIGFNNPWCTQPTLNVISEALDIVCFCFRYPSIVPWCQLSL